MLIAGRGHWLPVLLEIKSYLKLQMTYITRDELKKSHLSSCKIIKSHLGHSDHSEQFRRDDFVNTPVWLPFFFPLQADSNKTRIDEANQRATKMLGSG